MDRSLFFEHLIPAPRPILWKYLTDLELIASWMGDEEMHLTIETEWVEGSAIVIRADHNGLFENRGDVLSVVSESLLAYDYISSISDLPDLPENRTRIQFELFDAEGDSGAESGTLLKLTISGFPTASIYHHVAFYWRGTLGILSRKIAERSGR